MIPLIKSSQYNAPNPQPATCISWHDAFISQVKDTASAGKERLKKFLSDNILTQKVCFTAIPIVLALGIYYLTTQTAPNPIPDLHRPDYPDPFFPEPSPQPFPTPTPSTVEEQIPHGVTSCQLRNYGDDSLKTLMTNKEELNKAIQAASECIFSPTVHAKTYGPYKEMSGANKEAIAKAFKFLSNTTQDRQGLEKAIAITNKAIMHPSCYINNRAVELAQAIYNQAIKHLQDRADLRANVIEKFNQRPNSQERICSEGCLELPIFPDKYHQTHVEFLNDLFKSQNLDIYSHDCSLDRVSKTILTRNSDIAQFSTLKRSISQVQNWNDERWKDLLVNVERYKIECADERAHHLANGMCVQ